MNSHKLINVLALSAMLALGGAIGATAQNRGESQTSRSTSSRSENYRSEEPTTTRSTTTRPITSTTSRPATTRPIRPTHTHPTPPPPPPAHIRIKPMRDHEFKHFYNMLCSVHPAKRMNMIIDLPYHNLVKTSQVKKLALLFQSDDDRLNVLKQLYKSTTDKKRYENLGNVFRYNRYEEYFIVFLRREGHFAHYH